MAQMTRRSTPPLLWAIALLSLMMNIVICGVLVATVIAARSTAGKVADQLETLGNSSISTSVKINQAVRLDLTVPFTFTDSVAIQQTIPINTVVPINQDIPLLGAIKFDVPINVNVPINANIPITIVQSIPINTSVPINFDVPVVVQIRDTALKQQIDGFVTLLRNVAGE
jgi:hypothetical protein